MPKQNNYILGKGRLYFDPYVNGSFTGSRHLGNAPSFSISVDVEKIEHYSSTNGIKTKDDETFISTTRNSEISLEDISPENMALFVLGDVSSHVQSTTPIVNEAHTVKKGLFYHLGDDKHGVQNITVQEVTNEAGTTTYTEGTDYLVDTRFGSIEILTSGAIADDSIIHVDYTPAAGNVKKIVTNTKAVNGRLIYISQNAKGQDQKAVAPWVSIQPNGAAQFIGDDYMNLPFNIEFLKQGADEQLYLTGAIETT